MITDIASKKLQALPSPYTLGSTVPTSKSRFYSPSWDQGWPDCLLIRKVVLSGR
jgi:hypothetical protein